MGGEHLERGVDFMKAWLSRRLADEGIPGLSVAVYHKGQPLWRQAYGMADIEAAEQLTPEHLFLMASQTKMLTAVACLQLAETGQLKLGDHATKYLPWLKTHRDARIRKVTVLQLLSHSGGLVRDGSHSDFWLFKSAYPDRTAFHKTILSMDLCFEPGTSVKYSNLGYGLLGEIIGKVARQPYKIYIQNHIVKPFGLQPASIDYNPRLRPIAMGYGLPQPNRARIPRRSSAKSLMPAIGLYATPDAMCRFALKLCDRSSDNMLRSASKKRMQQAHSQVFDGYDAGTSFGLGHELQEVSGHQLFGHSGHAGGHVTGTQFDPKLQLIISIAAISKDTPTGAIMRGLFGIAYFFMEAKKRSTFNKFDAHLVNEMSTIQIVSNGERLVAIDPDCWEPFSWCEELAPAGPNMLKITTPHSVYNQGELVRYFFDDKNRVKRVRFAGLTHWPYQA